MDTMTQTMLIVRVPLLDLLEPEIPIDPRKHKQKGDDHPKKKPSHRSLEKIVLDYN